MTKVDPLITPKPFDAAIEAVRRGWFIFPCQADKTPIKGMMWKEFSSSSEDQISKWHDQYHPTAWGVDCLKSGVVCADIDNAKPARVVGDKKIEGKEDGHLLLNILLTKHGLTELSRTLTVRTQSGAEHHIFDNAIAECRAKVPLKKGHAFDVLAAGRYFILYGSVGEMGTYTIIDAAPVAPCPRWLVEEVGRAHSELNKQRFDPKLAGLSLELDKPAYIELATEWLITEAPDAVLKASGDTTTLKVFYKLKDMGISHGKALELATEFYNPTKCFPPWDLEGAVSLQAKCDNAYEYGKFAAGCDTTEFKEAKALKEIGKVESKSGTALTPAPLTDKELWPDLSGLPLFDCSYAHKIDESEMEPRPWVVKNMLLRGYPSIWSAPGGTIKSTLGYTLAVSVASGLPLLGECFPIVEPGPVVYFCAEESLDEMEMKLLRCIQAHNLMAHPMTQTSFGPSGPYHPIILISGMDRKLCLVDTDRRGTPKANRLHMAMLAQFVEETESVLLICDSLRTLHHSPENDNTAMGIVMDAVGEISTHVEGKVATLIMQHARKDSDGEVSSTRGAGAIVDTTRITGTLLNMTPAEAKQLNVPEADCWQYAHFKDWKLNFGPRVAPSDLWYKKTGGFLANGENVSAAVVFRFDRVKILAGSVAAPEWEILKALELVGVGERMRLPKLAKAIGNTDEAITRNLGHENIRKSLIRHTPATWAGKTGRVENLAPPGNKESELWFVVTSCPGATVDQGDSAGSSHVLPVPASSLNTVAPPPLPGKKPKRTKKKAAPVSAPAVDDDTEIPEDLAAIEMAHQANEALS